MKNLFFTLILSSGSVIYAQDKNIVPKTIEVTSSVSNEYQPDYYEISVTLKEYENINSEDQKVTRINLADVEQAVYKKLDEIGIKSTSIEVGNLYENYANQNNYGYANVNYTGTQKRELSKTFEFQVKTIKELEKTFLALRINGVNDVQALPTFTNEKQIEIEKELLKDAMEKAKIKANTLELLTGKKLGDVNSVSEQHANIQNQTIYNYNYGNNKYWIDGNCTKSLSLIVNYSIE